MCKMCGNPDCKADEMFEEMMNDENFNPMEALKEMLDNVGENKPTEEDMQKLRDVERDTVSLQEVEITDARVFTSKLYKPEDNEPVYTAMDSSSDVLDETMEAIRMNKSIGDMDDEEAETADSVIDTLEMLKKMMGDPVMSLCVIVTKSRVTTQMQRNGEVVSEMIYTNVKTADDLLKLVSFHSEHFVDPMLKDFDTISDVLNYDK